MGAWIGSVSMYTSRLVSWVGGCCVDVYVQLPRRSISLCLSYRTVLELVPECLM